MARRARGDPNRPHECVHTGGAPMDEAPKTYTFASHDELAFHIIRHHLILARDIPGCDVDCPMLAAVAVE